MSVIWSGVTEQGAVVPVQVDESGKVIARADVAGDYVKKTGDTMSGALVLPSDPSEPLQASTKQYVDSVITDTKPFAMGTFFPSFGVIKSININSVRAKPDGVFDFYFENIPGKVDYVVIAVSNGGLNQVYVVGNEILYFSIRGIDTNTGAGIDSWGCNFVVWRAPEGNDVRIS